MKDWWTRIIILALLAIVLGVPFVFKPSGHSDAASGNVERLVIVSPHNEQIRFEFESGFNRYRASAGKTPVDIDWRSSGGTSDLRKMVIAEYEAKAEENAVDEGIGVDLFFGGGDYEHGKLASGVKTQKDGETVKVAITIPIELPDGLLEKAYPSDMIGGERLYHRNLSWVGVALSSFGIVYNRDVLNMIGVQEPKTWADLKDGRYVGWLALADPAHSGSLAATYNTILRRNGWNEGWALLRRVFANARYFTSSAGKVPVDVSAGEAAAGMCIDFYGRYQSGAIGGDRVGYVDPINMTAITADPITILHGAPNAPLANEFIVWLLSEQSQRLWQRRMGVPGGPERFELRRLPIRHDMYNEEEMAQWKDHVKPFEITQPFPKAMPNFYGTVAPVAHAMAIDIHSELQAAWIAIVRNPHHPNRKKMLELFDAMPEPLMLTWPDKELADEWPKALGDPSHTRHKDAAATLKQFMDALNKRWKDSDQQLKDRLEWTLFFRGNYREIVRLASL